LIVPEFKIYHGDCLNVMRDLKTEGTRVHSVVCDPPYHFASIVSRFGKEGSAPTVDKGVFRRSSKGFMGKEWDGGDIAFDSGTWSLAYDLLLPGGHLLAFAATKNYHRMAVAIEDAGFEIRDQIGWLYGTGFPKSHEVGGGWKTALKPAWEPICVARKPIEADTITKNVSEYGTGGLNIEGCRVPHITVEGGNLAQNSHLRKTINGGNGGNIFPTETERRVVIPNEAGRFPANVIHDGSQEILDAFPQSKDGVAVDRNRDGQVHNKIYGARKSIVQKDVYYGGQGSAARFFYSAPSTIEDLVWNPEPASYAVSCSNLNDKAVVSVLSHVVTRSMPALELISTSYRAPSMSVTAIEFEMICESVIVMMKSLEQRYSRGSLPKNITLNLNPVKIVATNEPTGIMMITISHWKLDGSAEDVIFNIMQKNMEHGEKDLADNKRFHYSAKASKKDRVEGSTHPTVKPVSLMRYLVRLVTPVGGTVLDPFAGTGTTLQAAYEEGFNSIGIEREVEYIKDIAKRMSIVSERGVLDV
jgi:DNA modification methylase